jgi:CheY-like chemotaxis protein
MSAMPAARVLVVDDDPVIQKLLQVNFEMEGYSVITASDGAEGLERARTEQPDIVILDVMMPKMNGLMVLQTLRANPETEHTPVVVLSNYMEPPLIQRALQLGAIEYVVKSQARPEQLVDAIPLWLIGEPALH